MAFSNLKKYTQSVRDHNRSSRETLRHMRQIWKVRLSDAYLSAEMLLWKCPPIHGFACLSLAIAYWEWFIASYLFKEA